MEDELPVTFTHRLVAGPGTAKAHARAFVRFVHRQPRMWAFYGYCMILVGVVSVLVVDEVDVAGLLAGLVVSTLMVVTLLSAVVYRTTLRNLRARLFEGAVLETGFGDEAFVSRNPTTTTRNTYAAIRSVDVEGPVVLIRYDGNPVTQLYARELFPDDELARLRSFATARR